MLNQQIFLIAFSKPSQLICCQDLYKTSGKIRVILSPTPYILQPLDYRVSSTVPKLNVGRSIQESKTGIAIDMDLVDKVKVFVG